MDSAPRARASSPKTAARVARPRRKTALLVLLAGSLALLLLGWGAIALRQAQSSQAKRATEGVRLARQRAGELTANTRVPVTTLRTPESSLPANPTSLPMPGPVPFAPTTQGPRYLARDSVPPRPAPGHLFVDTQPESTVWINGEPKGKTPLDVMVGPGHKTLRLETVGFRPIREAFDAGQGAVIRRALIPLSPPR